MLTSVLSHWFTESRTAALQSGRLEEINARAKTIAILDIVATAVAGQSVRLRIVSVANDRGVERYNSR